MAFIAFLARWHRPLIGVAIVLALMFALNRYVADAVHDDRIEATVEAQKADARADDLAGQVAASEAATIEQENASVRRKALGSDDHLKSGFDSLRQRKAGGE